MRIFLTGFMGAGKTTVGRLLASLLDCEFVDTDSEIERIAGQHIAGIFEDLGEGEFRTLERQCLSCAPERSVVATGGGCFIYNTQWMLENGTVVYLDVSFETLAARIGADPLRPLWKKARRLFEQREAIYRKAQIIVDGSPEPDQVAAAILQKVNTQPIG